MVGLKKFVISFLMMIISVYLNDNPKSAGIMLIGYYVIASIHQSIAIVENRPQYKKMFKYNFWITAVIVVLFYTYLLIFPKYGTIKYNVDITNTVVFFIAILWSYIVGYINLAIVGLLTIFWLTSTKKENIKNVDNFIEEAKNEPQKINSLQKGKILIKAGKYKEALTEFNSAIKLDSNNMLAYYYSGLAYFKIGEKDLALQNIKAAAKLGHEKSQKILESTTTNS
jgi:tetratricopeptide (TPR) repeat protein